MRLNHRKRSEIQSANASESQIGNGISDNSANTGASRMIQVVLPRLLKEGLRRNSKAHELQQEHERDPYYLLKQRVNKAKSLAWNRRAKSALTSENNFPIRKKSVPIRTFFQTRKSLHFPTHGTGKQSTLQHNGQIAGSATVHSVYIVISKSPEIPMRLTNEQVAHAEAWDYKPCFKSDEVHDSRNPEFSTCLLSEMPITGDRALRADIYVSHTSLGKDHHFGSAVFSLSELLQETNREMSVRVDSTSTKIPSFTFATRRAIIHTIPKLLNVGASWQVHIYTVSQNLAPEFCAEKNAGKLLQRFKFPPVLKIAIE